jgi:hypothetical protein
LVVDPIVANSRVKVLGNEHDFRDLVNVFGGG